MKILTTISQFLSCGFDLRPAIVGIFIVCCLELRCPLLRGFKCISSIVRSIGGGGHVVFPWHRGYLLYGGSVIKGFTVDYCAVSCASRYKKGSSRKFFHCLLDLQGREAWVKAISRAK